MKLDGEAIRNREPFPLLSSLVLECQGLSNNWEWTCTAAMELYSNGGDHGLLDLDPVSKETPDGFMGHQELYAERLSRPDSGALCVRACHWSNANRTGEALELSVEERGPGLNRQKTLKKLSSAEGKSSCGRLSLPSELCTELRFQGNGNHVTAVYTW